MIEQVHFNWLRLLVDLLSTALGYFGGHYVGRNGSKDR